MAKIAIFSICAYFKHLKIEGATACLVAHVPSFPACSCMAVFVSEWTSFLLLPF